MQRKSYGQNENILFMIIIIHNNTMVGPWVDNGHGKLTVEFDYFIYYSNIIYTPCEEDNLFIFVLYNTVLTR